ncbi:hypothetical protein QG37_07926 [Candidozyma auris]|uniref:Uncharacterized protein n=1 Tax=Candidozyma auris TaxID=498019 RepID=A0A0L0NP73_CANAR|nr:hypothetical protein QG37_07926 [[Candida] auris]
MDWDWAKETQETKRFIQTSFEFRIVYFFLVECPVGHLEGGQLTKLSFRSHLNFGTPERENSLSRP